MQVLAIRPKRLDRMRAAGDGGQFKQITEGRFDDRHLRVEQNRKSGRDSFNTGHCPYDRNHRSSGAKHPEAQKDIDIVRDFMSSTKRTDDRA